jgi:poly-gamma-glutamate synthesis protein (capsule biosynthesis protein)
MFRGIEVYNGAPIFYSLGSFIQQNLTIPKSPADHYETYDLDWDSSAADLADARAEAGFMEKQQVWEGALPVCHFETGELKRIEIHPIDLGFDESRYQRGAPLRANTQQSERIIDEISELSEKYNTEIVYEDGIGVIEAPD